MIDEEEDEEEEGDGKMIQGTKFSVNMKSGAKGQKTRPCTHQVQVDRQLQVESISCSRRNTKKEA